MSFVCLAESQTHTSIIELEHNAGSLSQNFSIKPEMPTLSAMQMIDIEPLQGKLTEIISTNSYSGSDTPPDDKPYRPGGLRESLTTVVESASWHLLYAFNEVIGYKLILTLQEGSPAPQSLSLVPVVATVVVGWMTRSHWYPESPIFNQLDEQESNKQHELQIIILMDNPSGGYASSTGTWGQDQLFTTHSFTSSSHYSPTSYWDGGCGDDGGWPGFDSHTRTEICWAMPCGGYRCQYAPSLQQYQEQEADSTTGNLETSQGKACGIDGCTQRFTWPSKKRSHQAQVHSVGGKVCGIEGCTQRFTWPSKKRSHQAEVHGVGGEACGINGCTQRFTEPCSKKSHQAQVHGVGGKACGIEGCTQRFTWPSQKRSHQAEVHGVGGEACGINGCTQHFTKPCNKKSHQAEVHGVGGEACGINGCTQRFIRPSKKKSHQAKVHGVVVDLTSKKKRKRKRIIEEDGDYAGEKEQLPALNYLEGGK